LQIKQNIRRALLYSTALTGFLLAIGISEQAGAQTFIWSGATSDYDTAANWSPSAGAPPNSTTATAPIQQSGRHDGQPCTPVTVES